MLEMWTNDQKVELAGSGQGGLQIREFTRSRGFRLQAGSIIISTENPNPSNPNINWLLTRSSQLAYDPYICQASDANIHFQFQYAPRPDLTDTLFFCRFFPSFETGVKSSWREFNEHHTSLNGKRSTSKILFTTHIFMRDQNLISEALFRFTINEFGRHSTKRHARVSMFFFLIFLMCF